VNRRRAVAAQTARSRTIIVTVAYVYYFMVNDSTTTTVGYMALESLLSCISPFVRHLRNQWPWISLRGHPRSSIWVPIESAYTYSY